MRACTANLFGALTNGNLVSFAISRLHRFFEAQRRIAYRVRKLIPLRLEKFPGFHRTGCSLPCLVLQNLENFESSGRDGRTRSEDGKSPVPAELVVILRWNDAADYDGHVFVAESRKGLAECGHQGQVTRGKRTWSDDIDVSLDGLTRGLFGRLKQRAKDHVESEIRESRSHHLLTAVILVTEAVTPGSSVSLVARLNGISSSLLFR
jgi:hypothetical protein